VVVIRLFGINTLLAHAGREAFSREEDTADVEGKMLAAGICWTYICLNAIKSVARLCY
jgi:hypothetical protein